MFDRSGLPKAVTVYEVGPRDGLQNEARVLPVQVKAELIRRLAGTGLPAFAEVCGELLARGHARSGDPLVISGYLGNGEAFAEALARFGSLYADQTEKDWQALRRSGKVEVPKRTR